MHAFITATQKKTPKHCFGSGRVSDPGSDSLGHYVMEHFLLDFIYFSM